MIHALYQILSGILDLRAASRGPAPLARRIVRKSAHRVLAQQMRKAGL